MSREPLAGEVNLLYVDDEPQNLYLFRSFFEEKYNILTAESGSQALDILARQPVQVLFADQRMPGMNGIQLLEAVAQEYPETVRVLVTGYSDIDVVIDAINRGAVYRYLSKPWDVDEVSATIRNALEIYELRRKNRALIASLDRQNQLLRRKVEELRFLNELQLELKGLRDIESIAAKVIERLKRELGADYGFYCEGSGESLNVHGRETDGQQDGIIEELVSQIDIREMEVPYLAVLPGDRNLCVLPLVFQGTHFGCLAFLFAASSPLDSEELPFAEAASHVVSSVLYSYHVQRQEMKREQLFLLGQMASMIIHDLKGPLATIMGFVSLLQADLGPAQREEFAGIINQEVRRLIDLVEELLSFSKGETHLDITTIDLHSLVSEIVELFDLSFKKENISTEISLNGLHSLAGDRKKLKKVFINLFQNAREYLQSVDGRRCIQVVSTAQKDTINICFINNGPQIPSELLPRLFDPFFSYKKDCGTGLGLTICKKIVEEHHGSLQVFSEPGKNEFRIILPVRSGSCPDE